MRKDIACLLDPRTSCSVPSNRAPSNRPPQARICEVRGGDSSPAPSRRGRSGSRRAMASPHRAARQLAASLHLPVNPTTGASVSQYEREDALESLVATALAAAMEEEQKTGMRPARASAGGNSFTRENEDVTFQDIVDFSDVHHSNEEYFRKLRELKAAHAETMAKLEKLYQDKLSIKDVWPVITREDSSSVSSSSVLEQNCPHPGLLVTSYSEPDIGRSPSLSTTSDEELPSLEREAPGESRMTAYAKELINNMWTDFSVEDYIQYDSDVQTPKKTRKKHKSWVPRVTVPVPFQMTVREQKRREAAQKARSDPQSRQKLLKRDDDDDVECKKKFRANPVPSCILQPFYEDLVRQNEERRRTTKEKSKAALLASQKPFTFIAREEQKQAIREKQLRDLLKSKRKTKWFKARPVPRSIYRSAANDKSKEDEFYRDIRTQLKARELLQNLSWPCRQGQGHFRDPRSPGKPRDRHKCRCLCPDDGDFAEKQWKEPFSEPSFQKRSTLCKQCDLRASSCDSAKRQKVLADLRADEENLKEIRWPHLSPRLKLPVRSGCTKPRPCPCSPPMPTLSSRGREQAIRKSEKARMKEYRRELKERDEKLQQRPMLFERVAQVVFVGM